MSSFILRAALRSQAVAKLSASRMSTVASQPETRITTLANGLRVASEQTPHKTATIGVYIDAGSRFENDANNGTAHFLEHMAFKGTSRRTQNQLELEVENIGAHLNAYTSREHTAYFVKCLSKDADKAVDMISDILQNSTLQGSQIDIEREVILREMKEVNDQTAELVFDHLHATAFQGTALGRTILGPERNICSITRDDLARYIKEHYTAPRIVLAAAGGIDHDQLVKLAEKSFSGLPNTVSNATVAPCAFTGSEIRDRNDDLPKAHVAVAVESVGWNHPDFYALYVANAIVGNWDRSLGSSQLLSSPFARLVTSNQLAHSFTSFQTTYSDTGLWGTYGVCDRESLEDFVYALQQEWMRICTSVTDAEVARAGLKVKSGAIFQADGTTPLCEEIGRQVLAYGRRVPVAEIDARISEVTASKIKDVCKRYIFDKCPAVAAVGPIEGLPDYNRIRSQMNWLRL